MGFQPSQLGGLSDRAHEHVEYHHPFDARPHGVFGIVGDYLHDRNRRLAVGGDTNRSQGRRRLDGARESSENTSLDPPSPPPGCPPSTPPAAPPPARVSPSLASSPWESSCSDDSGRTGVGVRSRASSPDSGSDGAGEERGARNGGGGGGGGAAGGRAGGVRGTGIYGDFRSASGGRRR